MAVCTQEKDWRKEIARMIFPSVLNQDGPFDETRTRAFTVRVT